MTYTDIFLLKKMREAFALQSFTHFGIFEILTFEILMSR